MKGMAPVRPRTKGTRGMDFIFAHHFSKELRSWAAAAGPAAALAADVAAAVAAGLLFVGFFFRLLAHLLLPAGVDKLLRGLGVAVPWGGPCKSWRQATGVLAACDPSGLTGLAAAFVA